MSTLWRDNRRSLPRGLIWSSTHRGQLTTGPDIQYYLFWGEIATGTTAQGTQTIDAVGDVVQATAGVAQGSQTIDASGIVKADGPATTAQGSQTIDAFMSAVLDAVVTVGQGSQSVQGYGDAHTVIPFYGVFDQLWRVNTRFQLRGLIWATVSRGDNTAAASIGDDLFWGWVVSATTGQGSQTIGASGNVIADATQGTRQGSQTIDATGTLVWDSTATTAQGSQTIAASGLVKADATATTAQGGQSIVAFSTIPPADSTVVTAQGGQTIAGNISTPLWSTIHTGQGKQSVHGILTASPSYITPSGIDSLVFGVARLYNKNQTVDFTDTGPDFAIFGTATIIGPRVVDMSTGSDMTLFGLANVAPAVRSILFDGFDSFRQGIGSVSRGTQYIFFEGFDSGDIRQQHSVTIYDADQPTQLFHADQAGDFSYFGDHHVVHNDRNIYGTGFESTEFGDARFVPHQIHPTDQQHHQTGIDSLEFGTARISNWIRYINFTGFDSFRYGDQWLSFFIRSIYPEGFDSSVVFDDFGPIDPVSGLPAGIYQGSGKIFPVGFTNEEYDGCFNLHTFFGNATFIGGTPRIYPAGFDSSDFSAAYEAADYGYPTYFANDNAIKVSHA